jgi:hypothetical protein
MYDWNTCVNRKLFLNFTTKNKGEWIFFRSGVGLSPLGTVATSGLLYKPQMIDEGDCGATGGMKIGRGNRSTWRKPAPVPLCHHKSHITRLGLEPGPPQWEASD